MGPHGWCLNFPPDPDLGEKSLKKTDVIFLVSAILMRKVCQSFVCSRCYECAADGCVTEDDLGVEKLCKAEAQVCFVGVGEFENFFEKKQHQRCR